MKFLQLKIKLKQNLRKFHYNLNQNNNITTNISIIIEESRIEKINYSKSNNIWIELENFFHLSISKEIKIIDNINYNIIKFEGLIENILSALYNIQNYLN